MPAKHVGGVKLDGSVHVYADFYLEEYGWIPVDATYRNAKPNVDYFGRIRAEDNLLVLGEGVGLTVKGAYRDEKVSMIQEYSYYWWKDKGKPGKISCDYAFKCEPVK